MMYLVTMDTWESYGSNMYVLGLYSSREAAEKTIAEFKEKVIGMKYPKYYCSNFLENLRIIDEEDLGLKITEIEPDKDYPIRTPLDKYPSELFETDICLGGYQE